MSIFLPLGNLPLGNMNREALKTIQKIRSFEVLPAGWHYGEGRPIPARLRNEATLVVWTLMLAGLHEFDAFPGASGEIMVTAYRGDHYIEAIIETDTTVTISHEYQDVEQFSQERMKAEEAITKLREIAGGVWNTSGFSTPNTLTVIPSKIGLKAWPSETPLTAVEHPLFSEHASTLRTQAYVITFSAITQALPANHRFFGYSTNPSFQRAAS